MNGRFSTDKLFGQVDVDTVSQVVYDSGRFLQGFSSAERATHSPGSGHRSDFECCSNLFVRRTLPIHLLLCLLLKASKLLSMVALREKQWETILGQEKIRSLAFFTFLFLKADTKLDVNVLVESGEVFFSAGMESINSPSLIGLFAVGCMAVGNTGFSSVFTAK